MKNVRLTRILLVMLALAIPFVVGGCPPGTYAGAYSGPGYYDGGYDDGYNNPPFVYNTIIDLYLRVIDPLGYAVPGATVELRVGGKYYKSYSDTSGQFWPIHNEFPGEWANFNDAFEVDVNKYVGQHLDFDIIIKRWGFDTVYAEYDIPNIDRDSVYVFFDEIVMY
jgi:hypothetical protein